MFLFSGRSSQMKRSKVLQRETVFSTMGTSLLFYIQNRTPGTIGPSSHMFGSGRLSFGLMSNQKYQTTYLHHTILIYQLSTPLIYLSWLKNVSTFTMTITFKKETVGHPVPKKKQKSLVKQSLPTAGKASPINSGVTTEGIEKAGHKIINALVGLNVFRIVAQDRQRVAIAAGYKNISTKSFRLAIIKLRNDGDIETVTGGKILLTDQGRTKLGSGVSEVAATPKTNEEMQAKIVKTITVQGYKAGCGKMVEALKDGRAKPRIDVANDMGFSRTDSHGFRNCLKSLTEHGMLENVKDPDGGSNKTLIRLSDFAFPQGRPA